MPSDTLASNFDIHIPLFKSNLLIGSALSTSLLSYLSAIHFSLSCAR